MSNKIVDLSVFQEQYLDVKLPSGEVMKLSKPTQQMVINLLKFRDINDTMGAEVIIDALDEIVNDILHTNVNAAVKPIDMEYVKNDLNMNMKLAIVKAYSEFITEVQSNPN